MDSRFSLSRKLVQVWYYFKWFLKLYNLSFSYWFLSTEHQHRRNLRIQPTNINFPSIKIFRIFPILLNRNRWLIFGSLNHFMKFLKCQNDQIGTLEKIKETMTVKLFQNISNVPFILKLIFNVPECSLFMFAQWAVFSPKNILKLF